MLRRSFLFSFFVLAASVTAAVEPPPVYSPEAQAVREAVALLREGDRLQEEGRAQEAREAWRRAIEAYRRAGYPAGEGETLALIAASYQADMGKRPEAMAGMLDALAQSAAVMAEFLDSLASPSFGANAEAEALLGQAAGLARNGDCAQALPLFEAAGRRYSGTGKLRALAGRLGCLKPDKEEDLLGCLLGFMAGFQEFMKTAQKLSLKAGPSVRYLRAVESAALGKGQEAEALLRSVLPELEAAGNVGDAERAALDLACVLIGQGRPAEAQPLLERARQAFAGRYDIGCQPPPAPSPKPQAVICLLEEGDLLSEAAGIAASHADVLLESGHWREARDTYQDLFCRSKRDEYVRGMALALMGLGKVEASLGNPFGAETLLQRALGFLPLVGRRARRDSRGCRAGGAGRRLLQHRSLGRRDRGVSRCAAALRQGRPVRPGSHVPGRPRPGARRPRESLPGLSPRSTRRRHCSAACPRPWRSRGRWQSPGPASSFSRGSSRTRSLGFTRRRTSSGRPVPARAEAGVLVVISALQGVPGSRGGGDIL